MPERKHVLGGTDAADLLGVGFRSPAYLYARLRGEVPDERMNWNATDGGKLFEEHVAVPLAKSQLGMELERPERMVYALPDEPRIGCSLDYEVVAPGAMQPAEIKATFSRRMWGDDTEDRVPPTVMAQCQHDMAVMRRCGVVVPVFHILAFMSWEFVPYEVEEDQELGDTMIDLARDMLACVDKGEEPETKNATEARLIFAGKRGEKFVCDDDAVALLKQMRAVKRARKVCEEQEDAILDRLLPIVGNATELVDPTGETLATWRPNKLFDVDAFREAHPEIYAEFRQTGVRLGDLRKAHKKTAAGFDREPANAVEATRPFNLTKKFKDAEEE